MNMLEKKSKGFTIIEIIVTMVIIGGLAAISLPAIFSQIQKNHGQEALNTMSQMRSAMESCLLEHNNDAISCDWDAMHMTDPSYNVPPGSNMGSKFTYWWPMTNSQGFYQMRADSIADPVNVVDFIRITKDATGITCEAFGVYRGIC